MQITVFLSASTCLLCKSSSSRTLLFLQTNSSVVPYRQQCLLTSGSLSNYTVGLGEAYRSAEPPITPITIFIASKMFSESKFRP